MTNDEFVQRLGEAIAEANKKMSESPFYRLIEGQKLSTYQRIIVDAVFSAWGGGIL